MEKPALLTTVSGKRVWWKVDLVVLPVVTTLFFLSFLDRVNLGNARVAGLQRDLNMTDHEFSIALTVTYVPYIAAELPSNLLLKRIGPDIMLPTMVALWGCVTIAQGLIKDYPRLLICRFFLGLLEGGLVPGLVLYLSLFYPRQHLQKRIAIFFSAVSLAGAFSGLLAFGIVRLDDVGHRPGWAWIFIIEGIFTTLFGLASYFLLPRTPAHARFLTWEEREYIVAALKEDGAASQNDHEDQFSWGEVGEAFRLPHVWIVSILLFLNGTILYSLAYFGPSIVHTLGYSSTHAQLMTVPPFAVAFVVAAMGSYISDHYRCRGLTTIAAASMAAAGFIIFLVVEDVRIRYGSLFLSIPGIYLAAPSLSTWSVNNVTPYTRRATASAFGFILANAGGILATWLIGTLSPPPHYYLATRVLLAFCVAEIVLSLLNTWYLARENLRKEWMREQIRKEEEEPGIGNRSAWFIYAL